MKRSVLFALSVAVLLAAITGCAVQQSSESAGAAAVFTDDYFDGLVSAQLLAPRVRRDARQSDLEAVVTTLKGLSMEPTEHTAAEDGTANQEDPCVLVLQYSDGSARSILFRGNVVSLSKGEDYRIPSENAEALLCSAFGYDPNEIRFIGAAEILTHPAG